MSRKQHYFVPRLESWRETPHIQTQESRFYILLISLGVKESRNNGCVTSPVAPWNISIASGIGARFFVKTNRTPRAGFGGACCKLYIGIWNARWSDIKHPASSSENPVLPTSRGWKYYAPRNASRKNVETNSSYIVPSCAAERKTPKATRCWLNLSS